MPKKTCEQRRQRRKSERPGEIIDAALELFIERGYAATRLDDVASHAGVSKGTLYLYFENKSALFKAVIRNTVIPELERAETHLKDFRGNATELLTGMLYQWWEAVGESRLCGLPKLIISEAGNFPEIARFYHDEVIARGQKIITQIYRLGVEQGEFKPSDPAYVARLVIAPMVFATMWKSSLLMFEPEPCDFKRYIQQHLDMLLNGIRVNKAEHHDE